MKKGKRIFRSFCCFFLAGTFSCASGTAVQAKNWNPNMIKNKETECYAEQEVLSWIAADESFASLPDDCDILAESNGYDLENLKVYPGGFPFGIRFQTQGVSVVGFCDLEENGKKYNPASEAGLKLKDVILSVNGTQLGSASDLSNLVETSGGKELTLFCRRGKSEFETKLMPKYCTEEGRYKSGIWVRDSGAGIGTVTFVFTEGGGFAGLGHGICESDSGELVQMKNGMISDVNISSVIKGTVGNPGELKGYFTPGKKGAVLGNTCCGVFGVFADLPEDLGEAVFVGSREELQEGGAEILCTLTNNRVEKYQIQISGIQRDAAGAKCFCVKVVDPELLALTGGIVQGMSGSPVLQNGKLMGAVTHVLINDPTSGYGIFFENMLAALPVQKA